MQVLGWSVVTWSYRTLTGGVEQASRLWLRLADGSSGRGRRDGQRRRDVVDPSGPVGGAPLVSAASPAAGRTVNKSAPAPTAPQPRPQRVPVRPPGSAPVTAAMVRRWAREQGIEVADRGRIPRSVMKQYLATAARAAPVRHRNRAQRPPSSAA
jgi:hypothetical protein